MPEPTSPELQNISLNAPVVIPVMDSDGDLGTVEVPCVMPMAAGVYVDSPGYDPEEFQQCNFGEPMQFATLACLAQNFLDNNLEGWGELTDVIGAAVASGGTWALPPFDEGVG